MDLMPIEDNIPGPDYPMKGKEEGTSKPGAGDLA
jgi:hypothetical protein